MSEEQANRALIPSLFQEPPSQLEACSPNTGENACGLALLGLDKPISGADLVVPTRACGSQYLDGPIILCFK